MIVWEYFIVQIPIQKALNIRNRKSGHCEEGTGKSSRGMK